MGHPTLTISSTDVNDNEEGNLVSYNITFTWNKNVSEFIESDIITVNGSLSNFQTGSASSYTVVFKPLSNGVSSLTVPANSAKNSNNQYNENSYTFTINQNVPIVSENFVKITPSGSVSTFLDTGLNGPTGLAFDKNGNLYCTNYYANTISKITPSGSLSTFANSGLNGAHGLAFDKNGNLFCANESANNIVKITPSGNVSTSVSSGLNNPYGLEFDKNGNLFCSNVSDNNIVKITPSGILSTFATGITEPQFLAFDNKGNLYTGTHDTNKLYRISSTGVVEELTIGAVLDDVEGLAFDHKGNLYAVSNDDNRIVKIPLGVPSEILVKERFPEKIRRTLTSLQRIKKQIKNLQATSGVTPEKLDALKRQYKGSTSIIEYLSNITPN